MEAVWNSRYDSGIGVIDEQHHELFSIVGRLRSLVQEGAPRSAVEALLESLYAASEHHFATEEEYMGRFGYPDLTQHVSEHATMLVSLQELKTRFRDSHQSMAMMVPTFMEGWLKHHISDGDFGFITFLKAHNLA